MAFKTRKKQFRYNALTHTAAYLHIVEIKIRAMNALIKIIKGYKLLSDNKTFLLLFLKPVVTTCNASTDISTKVSKSRFQETL